MQQQKSNVLTINGGSSSIRFALYTMQDPMQCILSGKIHRIGLDHPQLTISRNKDKQNLPAKAGSFQEAAAFLIEWLGQQEDIEQITCIGHRLVHGMQHTHAELINDALLKDLQQISEYDPDHLPAEIELIQRFQKHYPGLLQVACFDTAFHTGMPRVAKLLPIPRRFEKAGLQRYGFHGLSYAWLMETLKKTNEDQGRIILAHLGNGASMAAVKEGASVDTTMGFTPAGGLVMSERAGDMDPGIAAWIMQNEEMSARQFNHLVHHESGLLGVSGISADMETLLQNDGADIRAKEAVDLFCYSAKKWIGAYMAVLGGLDTLVFSGGIGENAAIVRSRICEGLQYAGIRLNEAQNNRHAHDISNPGSLVKVYVIPTDEEQMIAKLTVGVYRQSDRAKQ